MSRSSAWAPSSVRAILQRETYRGLVVWNKTRKRNADGERQQADRPTDEWMRRTDEDLRIVSESLWQAAHTRLNERSAHYNRTAQSAPQGLLASAWGARNAREPRVYLLSGFARCAACGASMQAASMSSTTGRLYRYACGGYVNRGAAVCGNRRAARMQIADEAVRELLANEVVRPEILERALDLAIDALRPDRQAAEIDGRRRDAAKRLSQTRQRLDNLTEAAARGGAVPALLTALQEADTDRRTLEREIEALDRERPRPIGFNPREARAELRGYLQQWQALTADNVRETRALLETVLRDRIVFRPFIDEGRHMYELTVPLHFDRVLVAAVPALGAVLGDSHSGVLPET